MSVRDFTPEDFEFKRVEDDPRACPHCGGEGHIILGDGGGPNGEATDTGMTYPCEDCGGTGDTGLVYVARQVARELSDG